MQRGGGPGASHLRGAAASTPTATATPRANAFEVNNEGEVTIEADKAKYAARRNVAHLLLQTPFPGRVLVTVERDQGARPFLRDHRRQVGQSQHRRFKGNHVPNIYVTATASPRPSPPRTACPSPWPGASCPSRWRRPIRALIVPIALKVSAAEPLPDLADHRGQHRAPGAAVTFAVVDEGILQMQGLPHPRPATPTSTRSGPWK